MTNITVHGTPISTYVRTVRLLLEEAGADYNLKEVGISGGDKRPQSLMCFAHQGSALIKKLSAY
ncbi:MAG TPA: hypothetical protein V6D15_01040 [Oculatellaceae cyanobacterium]|jgi:glutathione S-transferase